MYKFVMCEQLKNQIILTKSKIVTHIQGSTGFYDYIQFNLNQSRSMCTFGKDQQC